MNNLQVIKSEHFGNIMADIYSNDNNDMFMTAEQLAECLGYSNGRKGIDNLITRNRKLKTEEFSVTLKMRGTDGKLYNTRLFNEDGIYEVSILSKTNKAEEFRCWIRTVLKQIRLTGGYIPISEQDDEKIILAKAIGIYERTIKEKNNLISCLEPKAEEYDLYINSDGTYSMNQVGKLLHIGEYKLFRKLREEKILFVENGDNVPYQPFEEAGYFKVVSTIDYGGNVHSTTRVTPKGVSYICKRLHLVSGEVVA